MDKKTYAQKVILNKGGIAKTADFVLAGIKNYEVAALCKEGVIERIRRGFYQLSQIFHLVNGRLLYLEQLQEL